MMVQLVFLTLFIATVATAVPIDLKAQSNNQTQSKANCAGCCGHCVWGGVDHGYYCMPTAPTYAVSLRTTRMGNWEQVSPAVQCPQGTQYCNINFGVSMSKSYTVSASVSSSALKIIQVSMGYSFTTQAGISTTMTFPVPPGHYGYVTASPKYNVVGGALNDPDNCVTNAYVEMFSPAKLSNGLIDATYSLA